MVEGAHEEPKPKVSIEQSVKDTAERSKSLAGLTKRCFAQMARALDSLFVQRDVAPLDVIELGEIAAVVVDLPVIASSSDYKATSATPTFPKADSQGACEHFTGVVRLLI